MDSEGIPSPQLRIYTPDASNYQSAIELEPGSAQTPGLTPDDSVAPSNDSHQDVPYGSDRHLPYVPEKTGTEQHVSWGQSIDPTRELSGVTSVGGPSPQNTGLENPTSADPNGEVEAANEEPLDVVNPFELTVTQGPMGVAPAFKFLVQIFYLSFLLFIPRLYFSRVERILKSAEMSMEDMEHMVVVGLGKWNRKVDRIPVYLHNSPMYPAFMQFSSSWDLFIRSLMKEWKTFNLVSVLLSTAILTLLQIGSSASDPLIRNSAIMSLMCALMSLLYACIYIVRFAMMRKAHKALEWAEEAKVNGKMIFWNVWVLLALPAVWLAWSLILFMISVLVFAWRVGTNHNSPPPIISTIGRIGITGLFVLGIVYLILVLMALRTYGRKMDAKWQERVERWTKKHRVALTFSPIPGYTSDINYTLQNGNPTWVPSAGAFTPVYIPAGQLPHQNWPQFHLRPSPIDPRYLPLPPVTVPPFEENVRLPSPDSIYAEINASTEGIVPLTSFPTPSPPKSIFVPPSVNVTNLRPSFSIEPIDVHPQPLSSPTPPYSPRLSRFSQAHEQEAVQWGIGRTGLRNLVLRVPSRRHRPDMRRSDPYQVRPHCARSAVTIVGGAAMCHGSPSVAVTCDPRNRSV